MTRAAQPIHPTTLGFHPGTGVLVIRQERDGIERRVELSGKLLLDLKELLA